MASTGKIGQRKLSGVAALLVAGLLLAACGPEATPSTTTTINTTVPSSGSTSTAVSGVTAEPTVSTDSPRVDTPVTSETGTPGAMMETPGAMMETPGPGMMETPGAMTEGETIKVTMSAQNGSNQGGSATITDLKNGMVNVVLDISGPGTTEPQPAHIHRGTCADLDPNPAFPLSNAVDGKSVTEIEVNFADFTSASDKFAINVHKSAAEASVYVSCGDITVEGMEGEMPEVQETPPTDS
jgi:hypothetical protein